MVVDFYDRAVRRPTGVVQMAKFYVQSGSIRGIVDCYDSECAAVWAVNRVMEQITPISSESLDDGEALDYREDCGDGEDRGDVGLFALGDSIQISEQGFDRVDCKVMDSHMAFVYWHQLKRAIEAIHQQLDDKFDGC